MIEDSTVCPHMSPATYDGISRKTWNLVHLRETPNQLKFTWLSLLALPGTALFNMRTRLQKVFWVLSTSEDGLICLPLVARHHGPTQYFQLSTAVGTTWEQITIVDMSDWRSQNINYTSPREASEILGRSSGITFIASGSPLSIDKACGKEGFRTMTTPQMKQLYQHLKRKDRE